MTATETSTCPDPRTFYLDTIEQAVLSGLQRELRASVVLAEFKREYHVERQRLASRAIADGGHFEHRLAAIEREAARVLDMLIQDNGDELRLSPRSKELAADAPPCAEISPDHPLP